MALAVAATTAAIEVKVRMVCHSSQRAWMERQSAGRVADDTFALLERGLGGYPG